MFPGTSLGSCMENWLESGWKRVMQGHTAWISPTHQVVSRDGGAPGRGGEDEIKGMGGLDSYGKES